MTCVTHVEPPGDPDAYAAAADRLASPNGLRVLAILQQQPDAASTRRISAVLAMHRRRVQRTLDRLESQGLLTRDRTGTCTRYVLTVPGVAG